MRELMQGGGNYSERHGHHLKSVVKVHRKMEQLKIKLLIPIILCKLATASVFKCDNNLPQIRTQSYMDHKNESSVAYFG